MTFDSFWQQLVGETAQPKEIKTWSAKKGYLDSTFLIQFRNGTIWCDSPGAQNIQVIPKKDFQELFEVWDDYTKGYVQRQQVRDLTRFSTYIIGILHHYIR